MICLCGVYQLLVAGSSNATPTPEYSPPPAWTASRGPIAEALGP